MKSNRARHTRLLITMLLWFNLTSLPAQNTIQQILELELNRNIVTGVNTYKLLSNTGLFGDNNNVVIRESNFNVDHNNQIRLHRILNTDIAELEFNIEENPNQIKIGYQEFDGIGGVEYVFQFDEASAQFQIIFPGFVSPLMNYNSDTNFKILKCATGIAFLVDNEYKEFAPLDPNVQRFECIINAENAPSTELLLHLSWPLECSSLTSENHRYSILKKEIPQSESIVSDRMLRFTYLEKYAIASGINDQIEVNIYNRNHDPVLQSPIVLTNIRGTNYQEIDLDEWNIELLDYHLLEVKNANKNMIYYLRVTEVND